MPSVAGALPADERHQLATFIARITAPARPYQDGLASSLP
jgi:hypothetical protein